MNSPTALDRSTDLVPWLVWDSLLAAILFLATASVVVWQNSRLAVLWDLSYILENSYRISLGDVPYRDFPLPYAPLTFLIQAGLIKLAGRVFFHHVLYCAIVGGLTTVITWRILLSVLHGAVTSARMLALLLSTPLIVLGIYCIFPHPFYDADCTFAILLSLLVLLRLERAVFSPLRTFLAGATMILPLFVKQNTGLAFLGSTALALAMLMGIEIRHRRPLHRYIWLMSGAIVGVISALVAIHFTVGLANYWYWTFRFAASRRMPRLVDMLTVYQGNLQVWWVGAFIGGAMMFWISRRRRRMLTVMSCALMSMPFAWALICQFIEGDPSEHADQLLNLWPFLLIASFVFALLGIRKRAGIALVLPFILLGTVHGAFLSQQLWGSTYALWPLLILLIASLFSVLFGPNTRSAWESVPLIVVVTISMLVSGGFYVWSHERLNYANLSEGDVVRSNLPALAGLSIRGPWIPEFEQLVHFVQREVPQEEGMLIIPGEDPFYYATGRHPRFPVLMFDHTVNPFSPEQILEISRARGIRWLIVKKNLQIEGEPVEDKARLLELLRRDFKVIQSLENYDVYRKESSNAIRNYKNSVSIFFARCSLSAGLVPASCFNPAELLFAPAGSLQSGQLAVKPFSLNHDSSSIW